MMFSSENDKSPIKTARLLSLIILMLLIYVVVTIYQFIYIVSEEWIEFHTPGLNFTVMNYKFEVLTFISNIILFTVLFVLIRAVPRRSSVIKGTFLLAIPFFFVGYLARMTGADIFYMVAAYFIPSPVTFVRGSIIGYLVSPLAYSVVIAFVCIGAVFSRKIVKR